MMNSTLLLPKRCISTLTISSSKTHHVRPPLLSNCTKVPLGSPGRQSRLPPTTFSSSPAFSMRASYASLSKKPEPPSPAQPGSAKTHDQQQMATEEVQAPSVSFEGLGISRNMKLFLLVILGVFGSVETYFWCRAFWIWWVGAEGDGHE